MAQALGKVVYGVGCVGYELERVASGRWLGWWKLACESFLKLCSLGCCKNGFKFTFEWWLACGSFVKLRLFHCGQNCVEFVVGRWAGLCVLWPRSVKSSV